MRGGVKDSGCRVLSCVRGVLVSYLWDVASVLACILCRWDSMTKDAFNNLHDLIHGLIHLQHRLTRLRVK